jgi:O-methyltransferase involved in polyketide biosynthesis
MVSLARLKSQGSLVYVPVNFEHEPLADRLLANGFRRDEPAFFSWLGVTMYLSSDAIRETLRFVAQPMLGRSGIIFDYLAVPPRWDFARRWGLKVLMRRVAAAGEPWRTFFDPRALRADLTRLGFATVRDYGRDEINARFFANAGARLRVGATARMVLARI